MGPNCIVAQLKPDGNSVMNTAMDSTHEGALGISNSQCGAFVV